MRLPGGVLLLLSINARHRRQEAYPEQVGTRRDGRVDGDCLVRAGDAIRSSRAAWRDEAWSATGPEVAPETQ